MTDPTTSGTPGVEARVPGEDVSPSGAAGAAPGGTSLDASTGPYGPSEDVLGSPGDSLGDDDVIPQQGDAPDEADSSVTSTSTASEPPD
jgi:hypothetical protein